MPVYFYINPKVGKDIKAMTLSYTLFDVTHFLKKQKHLIKGRIELLPGHDNKKIQMKLIKKTSTNTH